MSDKFIRKDFKEAIKLGERNLPKARLRKAHLCKMDLRGCNLFEANLFKADLSEANLHGADLHEANLGGANLGGVDLRGANLHGANLAGANLCKADLREANFCRADLCGANLQHANLSYSDIRESDFSGTNLVYANLSYANLNHANFSGADLSDVLLIGAKLYGTNFSDANFCGVNITQSILGATIFAYLNLSNVCGLESVIFREPCILDGSVLQMSNSIPVSFLRGCGLSDTFIEYIPSLFGKGIEFFSCFISYNKNDKAFAQRVFESLQSKGIRCWLDEKQLLPGDDIHDGIDHGIRMWDKILLCASENSLKSWWVDDEIEKTFQKERRLWQERGEKVLSLIPLNLDDYMFSDEWQSGKKSQLNKRVAADFKDWKDHDKFIVEIEKVIKALRTDDTARTPAPEPKL